eukprot:2668966-Pleurochrysis_carterae.AAC.5
MRCFLRGTSTDTQPDSTSSAFTSGPVAGAKKSAVQPAKLTQRCCAAHRHAEEASEGHVIPALSCFGERAYRLQAYCEQHPFTFSDSEQVYRCVLRIQTTALRHFC